MHIKWLNAFKILSIIFFILHHNTKYAVLAEEVSVGKSDDDDTNNQQLQESEEMRMAKRSWQQLNGGWGKRNLNDDDDDDFRKVLQNPLEADSRDNLVNYDYEQPKLRGYILDDEDSYDVIPLQKRAWNSINNAWGKRGSALRPMGWKREPARLHWNNLRGMWGKRSQPQSWNKIAPAYIN